MDVPGLWSVPAAGGTETFVVADVRQAFWGIADAGIYFIVSTPQLSPGGPTIILRLLVEDCFDACDTINRAE